MSKSRQKIDFDVAILGGGPAGATLACYLRQVGISVVVFEKEIFPREHVGESMVPAVNRVLHEIGLMERMEEMGFPRKYGAAWSASKGRVYKHDWDEVPEDYKVSIRFDERSMFGSRNYTYHVDRAKFDHLILQHALSQGAKVKEGVRASRVLFNSRDFPQVQVKENGSIKSYRVRLVVDATGRHTLLGKQMKMKVRDPYFDQFAIHSWFDGFDRGSSVERDFIFIYFLPLPNTWMWQIPISPRTTSIGMVTQKSYFAQTKQEREAFFWKSVASFPDLEQKLKAATQLKPLREEGDYSYSMKQLTGDGWALIGDAARFVDPIFSSGVSIAMNSARLLSFDIKDHFAKSQDPIFQASDLATYEQKIRNGCQNWYEFISLYYRLNVLFTKYVHHPKYRLDVLKLLSGDVYDDAAPAVLSEMKKFLKDVEDNDNHILHPLLGDLKIGSISR